MVWRIALLLSVVFAANLTVRAQSEYWDLNLTFAPTFEGPNSADGSVRSRGYPGARILASSTPAIINGIRSRGSMVRLNSDGSLDESFQVPENFLRLFGVDPDGRMIFGEESTGYYHRVPVRRLLADGTVDPTFESVTLSGDLVEATFSKDGRIYLSGSFSLVDEVEMPPLVRLKADGGLDDSFTFPSPSSSQMRIELIDGGPELYIMGATGIGAGLGKIARLNEDGSIDQTFNPNDDDFPVRVERAYPNADNSVIVADSSGELRRLTESGRLDTSFSVSLVGDPVKFGTRSSDGKIHYITRRYVENVYSDELRRMNADFTDDETFTPFASPFGSSYGVNLPAILDDGSLIVGPLTAQRKSKRFELSRLMPDGKLDTGFAPRFSRMQRVDAHVMLRDGRHVIAGKFDLVTNVSTPDASDLVRLDSTGMLDSTFNAELPADASVSLLRLQSDGKLLAFGNFPMSDGQVAKVWRFNTDGSRDQSFAFIGDSLVSPVINEQGDFYAITSEGSVELRRYFMTGERDLTFDAATDSAPFFVNPLPGGGLVVGTSTSSSRAKFERLLVDGSLDGSFTPVEIRNVKSAVGLPDGSTIVVTPSSRVGSYRTLRRMRLDGGFDPEFKTHTPVVQRVSMVGFIMDQLRDFSTEENQTIWADLLNAGGLSVQCFSDGRFITNSLSNGVEIYTRPNATAPGFDPSVTVAGFDGGGNLVPISGSLSAYVASGGLGPFSYQWYHDGEAIPGETEDYLWFRISSGDDAGAYTVVISNETSSVTSEAALYTVDTEHEALWVEVNVSDQTAQLGGSVTFVVEARGNPHPTYQWYFNDNLLVGETHPSLTIDGVEEDDVGTYKVIMQSEVSNAASRYGYVTSSRGKLRLEQSISFAGPDQWDRADSPVRLDATASSGLPVNFEVVSGPASFSDDQLVLSGIGKVVVRASQQGNETYAASVVERTLQISWGAPQPTAVVFDNLELADLTRGRLIRWEQTSSPPSSTSTGIRGAMPFEVGDKDHMLRSLAMHLDVTAAAPNLRIKLCEDENGLPADAPLEVLSLNPMLPSGVGLHTFTSSFTPLLRANTRYWVVLQPAEYDTNTTAHDAAYTWLATVSGTANVPGSYWRYPGPDWEVWQDYPNSPALTLRVEAVESVPPTILEQPRMQRAEQGGSARFTVRAAGASSLLYSWKKDGVVIPGATEPDLWIEQITLEDVGDYSVEISDQRGTVESSTVSLDILPSGVSATHTVDRTHYRAGETITVSNSFAFGDSISDLSWEVLLPEGWSFLSSVGDLSATEKPTVGTNDLVEWRWAIAPESPIEFSYVLSVPSSSRGESELTALVTINQGNQEAMLLARPDPLYLIDKHRADVDGDRRLSLSELLRVIELYNTRDGTVRTGAYTTKAGEVLSDGFQPEPERGSVTDLWMSRYHSADSSRDGMLSLSELLRVIELYNTRDGTVRTGTYHLSADSADGFAPGPE